MQTLDYDAEKLEYEKPDGLTDNPGVHVSIIANREKRLVELHIGDGILLLTPGMAKDLARGLLAVANKLPKSGAGKRTR